MSINTIPKHGHVDEQASTIVRHCLERVYSTGDLSLVDELVAADFVGETTDSPVAYLGVAGAKAHVIGLRRVFNGFTMVFDTLHVDGDTFEVSWTARGTHERRFLGIDPTCTIDQAGVEPHGNRIAVSGLTTGRVSNGKMESFRMSWDLAELRRQLVSPGEGGETPTDPFDTAALSSVKSTRRPDASESTSDPGSDPGLVAVRND